MKREYNIEEYNWKLSRLNKYYSKQIFPPKLYMKKVVRSMRRYNYYMEYYKRYQKMPKMEEEYDSTQSVLQTLARFKLLGVERNAESAKSRRPKINTERSGCLQQTWVYDQTPNGELVQRARSQQVQLAV